MDDLYKYENDLKKEGFTLIAGVDEVGRGPLVGPVVASAVVLPLDFKLEGLTDSKKLSEKKRDKYFEIIMKEAIAVGVGIVDAKTIDEINILKASEKAMEEALNKIKYEYALVDGNMKLNLNKPFLSIIKGDSKSISIAAASVVAKVTRDKMMYELDKKYPLYGFKDHKGYPTKKHILSIEKYGLIEGYRLSYGPVKKVLAAK